MNADKGKHEIMDVSQYQPWVGRSEVCTDIAAPEHYRAWLSTLDYKDLTVKDGAPMPPLAHLIFNKAIVQVSEVGRDGHPKRGDFLPPVALPRRMWAGSKFEFRAPLRVGDKLAKRSEVVSVQAKTGSTGQLVFLVLRHTTTSQSGGEVMEEQTVVYRDDPKPAAAGEAPKPASAGAPSNSARAPAPMPAADFSRGVTPNEVMLFRYSAITFNGHRIHYDAPYAKEVEGYPGLVVHGPLLATLMVDLVARELPSEKVESFEFTARQAVTLPASITVNGKREGRAVSLWIENKGASAVTGKVTLR